MSNLCIYGYLLNGSIDFDEILRLDKLYKFEYLQLICLDALM